MAELKIGEDQLNEIVDYCSRAACGKILKRFEIIDNKDTLKKEVKELLYEEYRTLKSLLKASGEGLSFTQFKFKSREKSS